MSRVYIPLFPNYQITEKEKKVHTSDLNEFEGIFLAQKKSVFEGYISMPTLPKVVGKSKFQKL